MATPNFCSSCGSKLDGAAFCRNCGTGITQPVQTHQKRRGLLRRVVLFLLVGFGILLFIGFLANDDNSNTGSSTGGSSGSAAAASGSQASGVQASDAQVSTAPTQADLNSADYLEKHYEIPAESACEVGADDYLRQVAKYDYAWDKTGFLEEKFDSYITTVKSPGTLTLITKKAKLQNGFGAFEHVTLTCDFDTQAKDPNGTSDVSYSIVLPPDEQ